MARKPKWRGKVQRTRASVVAGKAAVLDARSALQEVRDELVKDSKLICELSEQRDAFKMQLLGTVSLLASCSVMLSSYGLTSANEVRDLIEEALADTQKLIPGLRWRRVLNAISVEVLP